MTDRFAPRADHRRLGHSAGDQSDRVTDIELQDGCQCPRRDQPGNRDDDTEYCPAPGAIPHASKETWPDGITDPEHEKEEKHLLRHIGDGHMHEISDDDACEQRTGDRAQADATYLEAAYPVAESDREEDNELGIVLQCAGDPFHGDGVGIAENTCGTMG